MLYATTRSKTDTYTAHRVLHEDRSPDGGFYIPFRMPVVSKQQLEQMKTCSFGENVAEILNLFFSAGLTGWDIDCAIGKSAAKMICMSHRVMLIQLWNNPEGDYAYICSQIYNKLNGEQKVCCPTDWAKIAIRIAVLFGIYGIVPADEFDISVNSGDFSVPMAVWYARKMGLPIGTIVCACNENSAPWDFLHRGDMNTGLTKVETALTELDIPNPSGLERLVFATLGYDETCKYVETSNRKGVYGLQPYMLQNLNEGMFVSVVGKDRAESVISSVYRSNQCVLDPYTAVSYGSLQDYRAKTGEGNPTVLLWEKSPCNSLPLVTRATGLSLEEIENVLNQL